MTWNKCPGCGKSTIGWENFCVNCGESLKIKCPKCGNAWRYYMRYSFCPNCGTKPTGSFETK